MDKEPEILIIDFEDKEIKILQEKGLKVEKGTFGNKYFISENWDKSVMVRNDQIGNIIEKDIVIVNMTQRDAKQYYNLESINDKPDGNYIVNSENQKEFNPINWSAHVLRDDFAKLCRKDSILIIFSDRETKTKYTYVEKNNGYCSYSDITMSNYDYLPVNIGFEDKKFTTEKFKLVNEKISEKILKAYNGKIKSKNTFFIYDWDEKETIKLIENIYGDLIGYMQIHINDNNTKSTVFILPQFDNNILIAENIIFEVLPSLYPEMLGQFVNDDWVEKEEYLLPDIKKMLEEKKNIEKEYLNKIKEIEDKILEKKNENSFLYGIIKSSGTGDKLVKDIMKCLELIGYEKVVDCDKEAIEDDKEEDLHIYTDSRNYFVAEVKGVSGPATEDDCNVIVKYKSRNCAKINKSKIHGAVFVNYHKNVEPNQREEFGFTKKEIKDAVRDDYTLIGTYELFKAIRLFQSGIITKESIRKGIETPGLFKAIPENFEYIGKIENILSDKKVICIPIECSELLKSDELLIINENDYYKSKIKSLMVNDKIVESSKRGDKTGMILENNKIPYKSAKIFIIND